MFGSDQDLPAARKSSDIDTQDDLLWALESLATACESLDNGADAIGNLSDDRAERIRWSTVELRDKGEVVRAERLLAFLHRRWPQSDSFLIELLVINVLFDPQPDRVRSIAEELRTSAYVPSDIALLVSFDAARADDMETAWHFWDYVNREAEEGGPFQDILGRTRLLLNCERSPADEALVAFLETSASNDNLHMAIREAAFFNRFMLKHPVEATSAALLVAQRSFDMAAMGHSMAFFSATRQDAEFDTIHAQLEREPSAWAIPHFAKWSCLHAIRTGDGAKANAALTRYRQATDNAVSQDLAPLSIAAAQAEELEARDEALSVQTDAGPRSDGRPSIFVGIFGQLRDYQQTLPLLVEHLQRELTAGDDGYDVKFGLATWDKVGARPLSIRDGVAFYKDLMPFELHSVVDKSGSADGVALEQALPNITRRMIELSSDIAARPVTAEGVGTYLPEGALVRIDDDAGFQAEVARQLPAELSEPMSHYVRGNMNQLRMWSRIAALEDLAMRHENEAGRPFDYAILIRSDLVIDDGSISTLLAQADTPGSPVISDYDPHAEYIEGIGDRYFIAQRNAAQALFEGFDWLLSKVRTASPSSIRLNPHEGASSMLFSTGRNASAAKSIFYKLHRGRFALHDLTDAVAADASSVEDLRIRHALDAILSG